MDHKLNFSPILVMQKSQTSHWDICTSEFTYKRYKLVLLVIQLYRAPDGSEPREAHQG